MSLQSLSIDSIREYVISNKSRVDLAWHLFIYAPLVLRPQFLRHLASSKYARYGNLPYIPLLIHIFLGLIIVSRYQFKAVSSTVAPQPEMFDIVIGVTNAIISWRLCKYEHRGNPLIARVAFQVMALMVLFASAMCYMTPSPVWYHALAKMHNAFIYVRWTSNIGASLRIFTGFREGYTIAVFFGGILGIWDARFPWDGILGVPFALMLHLAIVLVERFTSSLIPPELISLSIF
jgi:hypothetical protein